jgi:hypothetical protein
MAVRVPLRIKGGKREAPPEMPSRDIDVEARHADGTTRIALTRASSNTMALRLAASRFYNDDYMRDEIVSLHIRVGNHARP